MVNSLHEKSDHEEGDELPEDLNIRVEELSANIVGVEDRLNERLTASDRQRTDSLQVVTQSLNRPTAAVQRLQARDVAPRQSHSP